MMLTSAARNPYDSLAGEEFADQHSRFDINGNVTQAGGKQVDPVNYARLEGTDPTTAMRQRILAYVSRLVQLRTAHAALGVNDTNFFHVDFNDGKRVLVWQRGDASTDPVVVLANFSDFVTADASNPSSEYVVPNWPATPAGRSWREVTCRNPFRAGDSGSAANRSTPGKQKCTL